MEVDPTLRRHLEAVFRMLDLDRSGHIEQAEGIKIGQALGFTPPSLYWDQLAKLDADADGRVSMEEYVRGAAAMGAEGALRLKEELEVKLANAAVQAQRATAARLPEVLTALFDLLDASANGALSRTEVEGLVGVLRGAALDAAQSAGVAAFAAGLDSLFQHGLRPHVGRAEFGSYVPAGADARALASFVTMATEQLAEPAILQAGLDDAHLAAARADGGGGGVRASALDSPSKGDGRLRARFAEMDADGDGFLSREEVADLLLLEVDDAAFVELWAHADADGDGRVTFDEFVAAKHHFDAAEAAVDGQVAALLPE
jgi:Ca2+-binding EF-hand superfamily protein